MADPDNPIEAIQSIPWFHELTHDQTERLASISTIRRFRPGEVLYNEGDRVDFVYIILSGEINLENYIPSLGYRKIALGEPLDVIGWSCLTPVVRQATATVRVCQQSRLLAIHGEALCQLCDQDHELGFRIMRRVANIVATQFLSTRLYLYDVIQNSNHTLAQSNLF